MSGLEKSSNDTLNSVNTLSTLGLNEKAADKDKKADQVLLSEIEDLLEMLVSETKSGKKSSKNNIATLMEKDPKKVADILKSFLSGNVPKAKQKEVLEAIFKFMSAKTENIPSGVAMLSALLEGTEVKKDGQALMGKAKAFISEIEEAVETGKTTFDEIYSQPEVKAFISGLTNTKSINLLKQIGEALEGVLEGKDGDDEFCKDLYDIAKNAVASSLDTTHPLEATLTDTASLSKLYKLSSGDQKKALSELKNQAKGSTEDSKTIDGMTYNQAMISLAIDLQTLLTNIYNSEGSQSDIVCRMAESSASAAQSSALQKGNEIEDEMNKQAEANKKPWWTYLIGAVVAVVGAVLTVALSGFGVGVLIGVGVELLVSAIMMTPAGDAITTGLATDLEGGANPNGSGPSLGAQIGATAIITVITTILSMGSAGVTSATEGAANIGVGIGEAAAKTTAKVGVKVGEKALEETGVEMVEMSLKTVAKSAKEATEDAAKEVGKISEKIAEVGSEGGSEAASGAAKGSTKIKFDVGAFKAGLGKRFFGALIQNILGSGILIQASEAAMQTTDEGKKLLQNQAFMIGLAIVGTIVGVGAGIGANAGLVGKGVALRDDYIEKTPGLEDISMKFSSTVKNIIYGVEALAMLAQAGACFYQYDQKKAVADAQVALSKISAASDFDTNMQSQLTTLQSSISKGGQKVIQNATDNLSAALNNIGGGDVTLTGALSS
ncbi:MAG: hypothetical protein S4CHLAM20_07480 [Chlamydiia bacterium]|nr:hypothetical protein [Chlamydiia bacterium]